MDNKEKLDITLDGSSVATGKSGDTLNSNREYVEEPTVINLGANEPDRVQEDVEDDDRGYKKSNLRKRPKDATLQKFSAIACVLGILSCTIFLGNVPIAVTGILFGLTAEANKYKNAYTKIGLVCCAIGCLIGFGLVTLFIALVVLLIIALFVVALLALLALLTLLAILLLPL